MDIYVVKYVIIVVLFIVLFRGLKVESKRYRECI